MFFISKPQNFSYSTGAQAHDVCSFNLSVWCSWRYQLKNTVSRIVSLHWTLMTAHLSSAGGNLPGYCLSSLTSCWDNPESTSPAFSLFRPLPSRHPLSYNVPQSSKALPVFSVRTNPLESRISRSFTSRVVMEQIGRAIAFGFSCRVSRL